MVTKTRKPRVKRGVKEPGVGIPFTVEAQTPSPPQPTPPVGKWYLCPECKGLGWVASNKVFKMIQGVRMLRHIPCPRCNGKMMIKTADTVDENNTALLPIKLCPKCKNYYAVGGGHPRRDPCPHNHAEKSHCHWHDLSVAPPERGIRLIPPEPIEWQEPAQAQ